MIYFAQAENSDLIKIGTSSNVRRRMASLSFREKCSVSLLAFTDGSFVEEAALHARFAHLRERGEWFRPGPELAEFMEALPVRDLPKEATSSMTLHLPRELHEQAQIMAKDRFMSVTGLILASLAKELGDKKEATK